MKHYLLIFQTESEYQTYINGDNVNYPNVCYVINTGTVYYNNGSDDPNATTLEDFLDGDIVDVIIPNGTTNIREYSFYHWTNLNSVTVPESVEKCGMGAFTYCTSLPYENGVRYAGTIAVEITDGTMFPSVVIKDGTRILQDNFSDTGNANQVLSYTLPTSLIAIPQNCFYYCERLVRINSDTDGVFILPEGIKSIGGSAFRQCKGLTSITIPTTVITIGNYTFNTCSNLTSITLPDSVTSIGQNAFGSCGNLTSVTIGNGITSIGGTAFRYCRSLTSITIQATTPPTLNDNNVFKDTNDCPIYVPSTSVNAYKKATNWSSFASRIRAIQNS